MYLESETFLFSYVSVGLKLIKMELRETVKCDFRENFHVCSPHRELPLDTTPDPLTQLGEGLGGPKLWG